MEFSHLLYLLYPSTPPHLLLSLVVAILKLQTYKTITSIWHLLQDWDSRSSCPSKMFFSSYFLHLGAIGYSHSSKSQSSRLSPFPFISAYKMVIFPMIFSFSCNILPNAFNSSQWSLGILIFLTISRCLKSRVPSFNESII